jgi:hypothetical protein
VFSFWAEKMCQVFVTNCDGDLRLLGIHCILFLVRKRKLLKTNLYLKEALVNSTRL